MAYGIELSINNRDIHFQLPVMPESVEASDGIESKTYDVVGLGEVNVIKSAKLSEYSFSSFFPAGIYPFAISGPIMPPIDYIKVLKNWMSPKKSVRFIFTSEQFDINTLVSIESLDWKEVAGSGGDIEYSIKLKQFVPYGAQSVSITNQKSGSGTAAATASQTRPNEQAAPSTYTLAAGDTLWSVAQKFLGNGARWPEIQKLNGITDAEIKRLQIGRVLKLP